MIVVYCFYPGDIELALKNAQWIQELGGCHGHELVAAYDPRCDGELVEQIRLQLARSFDKLHKCPALAMLDGWPEGANYFFRITTAWLQDKQQWPYFFWMEPDAIPMEPGWLDKLEAEYKRAGKPFMGDRVEVLDIPLHMSGIGIYHNPIYMLAGEAYRAHDTAWDMAAKDQIVPNAHFTDLIEHAWKHPTFHTEQELETQIAKETILFHSSKDGSLIDLLRQKRGRKHSAQTATSASRPVLPTKEPEEPGSPSPPIPAMQMPGVKEFIQQMDRDLLEGRTFDILIRTYPGDYEWLKYCLQSIGNFCSGFRNIWIVSPAGPPSMITPVEFTWKQMNDETEDGYLAQQITKCYADVITDYQPDYILHVDSDVIFTRPTTPGDFFQEGKLIWYYTPYSEIQTPWKPITEKFLGMTVDYEFMRRLPIMVPRWLYSKLREFCHMRHSKVISDYIRMQPLREFSEFNAMGAYAYFNYYDKILWVNTMIGTMPEPVARQFHSWSGLTPDIKSEIENLLGDTGERITEDAPPVSSQIKQLPSGVWVLEGDQISQWVEQEGRLDHDQNLLPDILRHIQPSDAVVDVGAFIGDHTIAYSHAVGSEGVVHAFEPNPMAYTCLAHNLAEERENHHVMLYATALGNVSGELVPLSGNNGNWGGAYVGEHMPIGNVMMRRLDDYPEITPNFIKIDVEGCELKVLHGGEKMIATHRPKMVIEINHEALRRQGATPDDIFGWLLQHNYDWEIIQENCLRNDPLYDILCLPKDARPPEEIKADAAHSHASPPVVPSKEVAYDLIDQLKSFADQSPGNKAIVTSRLVYAGLRKPNKYESSKPKKFEWKRQRPPKKHKT